MTIKTTILNWIKRLGFIGFSIGNIFWLSTVSAEEGLISINQKATFVNQLKVTPERCVALKQGQICYQYVIFDWQAKERSEYCLFLEGKVTPVNCWSSANVGQYKLDFQSSETKRFILRLKNSQVDLASTQVVVAWVYGNKKQRRAKWRLF